MEVVIRRFNPAEDYEDVKAWWKAHKWIPVDLEILPKIGFMAQTEKEKLCCAWIYQSDSKLTYLEWLISNPLAEKEARKESIDRVIKRCLWTAKDLGYSVVYTSVKHPLLKDRYKRLGFKETDQEMTNMVRSLTGEI